MPKQTYKHSTEELKAAALLRATIIYNLSFLRIFILQLITLILWWEIIIFTGERWDCFRTESFYSKTDSMYFTQQGIWSNCIFLHRRLAQECIFQTLQMHEPKVNVNSYSSWIQEDCRCKYWKFMYNVVLSGVGVWDLFRGNTVIDMNNTSTSIVTRVPSQTY